MAWLNQRGVSEPGRWCTTSRTARVRRPSLPTHSTVIPLAAAYASTSARLSVLNTSCQRVPKSPWKLRTSIQRRRTNSSRTAGSISSYTRRTSASGVAPWLSGGVTQ